MNIYQKIIEITEKRQSSALCIITQTQGSTPREKGAKMIVVENGTTYGTIGGGELEYDIIQKAKEAIKTNQIQTFSFALQAEFKMACGGKVDIYIEPIIPNNKLIIFGAGHISKILTKLAIKADFDVTVIDERKNIFNKWKTSKINAINQIYDEAYKQIKFDKQTFVCSITHEHSHDKEIAALCGKFNLAYLGIIASRNKSKQIAKFLAEKHGFTAQQIQKIDMPMGIPINCKTPYEIAISVMAKLIDLKNNLKNT